MLTTLTRFQQQAVKHNLSSAAILLWQSLYFTMTAKNQFEELQQDSSMLMNILQLSRQGLLHVRRKLVDAGLLAVELDDSQKLRYTLMLEGKVVQPIAEKEELDVNKPLSEEAKSDSRNNPATSGKAYQQDGLRSYEEGKAALYDSLLHGDTKRFSLTELMQNTVTVLLLRKYSVCTATFDQKSVGARCFANLNAT